MNYELKHIHGVPYYLGPCGALYTLELDAGKPSKDCVRIGTYSADTGSIDYLPDWRERCQPRLDAFRASLTSQTRDTLRDSIIKPQKPRKTTRAPRKSAHGAKSADSAST